jgi:hypothetical protein
LSLGDDGGVTGCREGDWGTSSSLIAIGVEGLEERRVAKPTYCSIFFSFCCLRMNDEVIENETHSKKNRLCSSCLKIQPAPRSVPK